MSASRDPSIGKILITGVGRSGTTFLVRLFTLLRMDTGYTPESMETHIYKNCNAGLETQSIRSKFRIVKSPFFCTSIQSFVDEGIRISRVVVPVRKLSDAVQSRVKVGAGKPGGLWSATDAKSQLEHYHKCLATLIQDVTLNRIPTTFLSFDAMTKNPEYLYKELEDLFIAHKIPYAQFLKQYWVAAKLSRPRG